ncbi:CDP-alcohol phosphatidyltransferase family protein [Cytobacillus oceanisediminis]
MLDHAARRLTGPPLDRLAVRVAARGVPATAITGAGWLVGVGACLAVLAQWWNLALVLWLLNRTLDGLDGAVARQHGATDLGGFLDLLADFSIYAGLVLAVAVAVPDARLACVALLLAYYLSGTAFLTLSSILERRGSDRHNDARSLRFVGGLAEGTETVIAYVLITLLPQHAATIAWIFAAVVAVTALQRTAEGVVVLREQPTARPAAPTP